MDTLAPDGDPCVTTQLSTFGGVLTKLHIVHPQGWYVPQHVHGYDHQTLVVAGGFSIWQDDQFQGNYFHGAIVSIPAGRRHSFMSLQPNSAFACIHNMDLWEETELAATPGVYYSPASRAPDGVEFFIERLDEELVEEAEVLLGDHMESVGEARDAIRPENLALLRTLQDRNAAILTTARCGGRLVGYVLGFISPMLHNTTEAEGTCVGFYSDPSIPGLALRLQRQALENLRARGCATASIKVGLRGLRPRYRTIARRLGAQQTAEIWSFRFEGDQR